MTSKLILGGEPTKNNLILGGKRGGKSRLILGGGSGGNNQFQSSTPQTVDYGSASGYALNIVGNGEVQTQNAFGSNNTGNSLRSVDGLYSVGGSRKKSRHYRHKKNKYGNKYGKKYGKKYSKKGGNWGSVLGQAAVPFTLLGLQQTYGKKNMYNNKTQKKRNRSMYNFRK